MPGSAGPDAPKTFLVPGNLRDALPAAGQLLIIVSHGYLVPVRFHLSHREPRLQRLRGRRHRPHRFGSAAFTSTLLNGPPMRFTIGHLTARSLKWVILRLMPARVGAPWAATELSPPPAGYSKQLRARHPAAYFDRGPPAIPNSRPASATA
jgi:hypothetical protein